MAAYLQRRVLGPIEVMSQAAQRFARQDTGTKVEGTKRKDEIGALARSLDVFRRQSIQLQKLNAIAMRQSEDLEKRVKERTQELSDSEARLRVILENSHFGVSIVGKGRKRLYINPEMLALFGAKSSEEFLSYPLEATYANPDDWKKLRSSVGPDYVFEAEIERVRLDGTKWWCMTKRVPIEYDGEDAILVWHNDVTDRRAAEQRLRESESNQNRPAIHAKWRCFRR